MAWFSNFTVCIRLNSAFNIQNQIGHVGWVVSDTISRLQVTGSSPTEDVFEKMTCSLVVSHNTLYKEP